MILCITPNAALDRTLLVPRLESGLVARPTQVINAAGGKGFNVARAVQTLGRRALCAGFLGGHTGRLVAELARQEGLQGRWSWREAETRICTIVVVENTQQVLEIYEPGPPLAGGDWPRLVEEVRQAGQQAEVVCLSGSLPPGCPPDAPADLITALQAPGRPVWLDTSGPALRAALTARPFGLKINTAEAGELFSAPITTPPEAAQAAGRLLERGLAAAAITVGAQGAVLATAAGRWWAKPPVLAGVSPVGSGDSFLAGLVTALAEGQSAAAALRQAVAAGAANTLSPGGGRFTLADMTTILAQIELHDL